MNEVFGIEFTNHQAFVLLAILSVICAVGMITGWILMAVADEKFKPDLGLAACYIFIFSGIGFIVFSMLGGCFK